ADAALPAGLQPGAVPGGRRSRQLHSCPEPAAELRDLQLLRLQRMMQAESRAGSSSGGERVLPLLPLFVFTCAVLALEVFLARLLAYAVNTFLIYVVLGIAMTG